MKRARDNTCENLLVLPEKKWHPSPMLEHRTRNEERLALCLVLLLTPTPAPCHFQHWTFPSASVSPPTFCRSVDPSCCMCSAGALKRKPKEGMERQPSLCLGKNHSERWKQKEPWRLEAPGFRQVHRDNCAPFIEGTVQISSRKLGPPGLSFLPTVFNVLLCLSKRTCNCYRSLFTDVHISQSTQQPY